MKTVADIRRLADQSFFQGSFAEALHLFCTLVELQPLNLDARLRAADSLLALGEVQRAAVVYVALIKHAINSGYPLHALIALKIVSKLEPQFIVLKREFAERFAAGSPRLGRAVRRAPPDPEEPLVADFRLSEQPRIETLVVRSETLAATYEKSIIHYPDKIAPLPLLSLLEADELLAVLDAMELNRVQPTSAIIVEGEPGNSFYILARGRVRVTKKGSKGEHARLATLQSGSIFGEMALLSDSPRSATVYADTDCDLLEFEREALAAASKTTSGIAQALSSFTQERLLNNLLATAPLFKPLDADQRRDLIKRFCAYDAEPGAELIREGQAGRGLFLVLRGEMEVAKYENGTRIVLATLSSGDVFGEISLLSDEPTTATVTAKEKSTVLFLGRDYFQRLIEAIPEIKRYISRISEERLMDQLLDQANEDTNEIEEADIEILL
ncbi:MAG: cyclic nucleotide-binding domain-containing protein [Deltaproteobacteria bacterium]|nr:cyclic nucleotide-binding domain-containing protein [Deltaproteobacteria bacterium]